MVNNTLVSIIVITYNSSEYVLETLQSIKSQTYKNVELIITDDCSTDHTVSICQDWLSKNGSVFNGAKLLTSPINTGIAPNCNRGVKAANGEWIKIIAGDDLLESDLINSNMQFVHANPCAQLIISNVQMFENSINSVFRQWPGSSFPSAIKEQLRLILKGGGIKAPGVMIKAEILRTLNGFDEEFPMLEDDPFWVKCCRNGIKFHFNDKGIVYYRIHHSTSNNSNITEINSSFFESFKNFKRKIVYPIMVEERMFGRLFLLKSRIELTEAILRRRKQSLVSKWILFPLLKANFKINYLLFR